MNIDDRDLVFGRFLHTLGRRWWVPVGAGFAFVLIAVISVDVEYQQTTTFQAITASARLASAGFEPDVVSRQIPIGVDAAAISSTHAQRDVETQVDSALEVVVTPQSDAVVLNVTATHPSAASNAGDAFAELLVASRTGRFNAVLDSLQQELQASIDLLQAQIDEIDASLATAGDPSGSLANALLASRQDAAQELTRSQRQLAAVEGVRGEPAEVVTVARSDVDRSSASRRVAATGAFLFGFLLGIAALYLKARTDARARSRADVEVATELNVIGLIEREPSDAHVLRVCFVIAATARNRSTSVVQVVPADGEVDPALLAMIARGIVSADPGIDAVVVPPLAHDASGLTQPGLAIVVARSGRTRKSELQQIAADLKNSGREGSAVVLSAVPTRDVAWASKHAMP